MIGLRLGLSLSSAGAGGPIAPPSVGGVEVGSAGGTGTLYEGHTLSDGDDFNSLDLVSAANPSGAYFTNRMYSGNGGMRAPATGALAVMHDVSPDYTGWQDHARGIAQNYDSHTVSGSVLSLKAIRQTAPEQVHLATGVGGQVERAAILHTAGRLWYNSPAIIEWRARMPAGPAGQHPTLWGLSVQGPGGDMIGNEYGFEGNGAISAPYHNTHGAGSSMTSNFNDPAAIGSTYRDGSFHTYTVKLTATQYLYYVDGVLEYTGAIDPDTAGSNKSDYAIISNHVYNAVFHGESYSAAAWAADGDGVNIDLEWLRVWRPTATGAHYSPLASIPDTSIAYGATTTIVLPSQLALWGASGLTEDVYALQNEVEEPGGSNSASYDKFPTGVSYDIPSRTLMIANTLVGAGTLHFAIGVIGDGITCKPARLRLNVAPRWIGAASYAWVQDEAITPVDVYVSWDAGRLFQSGTNPKGLSVTGLPAGLSFDAITGLITGTPTAVVSGDLTITSTNSAGQTATRTQSFEVSAPVVGYAYESWAGPGWFDASDGATLTLSGTDVTAIANKRTGSGNLAVGGTGANIDRVIAGQNGLNVIRLVRDVSSTTSLPRLIASAGSAVSQQFQGSDKPFVALVVYKPTDTNTGFIFSAGSTLSVSLAETVALIRRNATASAARKNASGESGEVTFGSGQASGGWRIVAIKHSGTTVSVWDTSLTKAVNAAADDRGTISTAAQFMLFASATTGVGANYGQTQCNMDFAEIIIEATQSDADVQQAITDLATKWGITLA